MTVRPTIRAPSAQLRLRAVVLIDGVICHGTRCGRSAAINEAARFARGDLLLDRRCPHRFRARPRWARLAAALFVDPRVAGASGNIAVLAMTMNCFGRALQQRRIFDVDQLPGALSLTWSMPSPACPAPRPMYRRAVHPQPGRPRRRPGGGSGVHASPAPAGAMPYAVPGKPGRRRSVPVRRKPAAPARALGPRRAAHPLHHVWGAKSPAPV